MRHKERERSLMPGPWETGIELRRELSSRWSEKMPTLVLVLWTVRAEHGIRAGTQIWSQ